MWINTVYLSISIILYSYISLSPTKYLVPKNIFKIISFLCLQYLKQKVWFKSILLILFYNAWPCLPIHLISVLWKTKCWWTIAGDKMPCVSMVMSKLALIDTNQVLDSLSLYKINEELIPVLFLNIRLSYLMMGPLQSPNFYQDSYESLLCQGDHLNTASRGLPFLPSIPLMIRSALR